MPRVKWILEWIRTRVVFSLLKGECLRKTLIFACKTFMRLLISRSFHILQLHCILWKSYTLHPNPPNSPTSNSYCLLNLSPFKTTSQHYLESTEDARSEHELQDLLPTTKQKWNHKSKCQNVITIKIFNIVKVLLLYQSDLQINL